MRKVLVTGAAGFVGRHLVRRLLEAGDEVHAVDSLVAGGGGADPAAGWPLYDPRECGRFRFYREDCRGWFKNHRDSDFDRAFHLAAVVGGRSNIENNPLAVAEDLAIDSAFWLWAEKARPKKSVFFSSSAAYPIKYQAEGSHRLLSEEMISFSSDLGLPDLTYGWAKLTGEYLGRLAWERHGLDSACYRPFSGYGEDQDPSYPFPSLCRQALTSRKSGFLQVWGTGRQMRDFIHVEDCLDGVFATMDQLHGGDALNLSAGQYTSLLEFAKMARELAGSDADIVTSPEKPGGVFARAGDTAKQRQHGFHPKTPLREGIAAGLEYLERKAAAG